jgi:hypothetical protein
MSHINFTTLPNGILFDLSARTGAGTTVSKFLFRPSVFRMITKVAVYDDRMTYTTAEGSDFNFSYDGVTYPQLKINGTVAADNYDLFDQFIALL